MTNSQDPEYFDSGQVDPALQDMAVLGVEAETLLSSSIGQYLVSKANAEIDQAKAELVDAFPGDEEKIRALQIRARVAQKALTWLSQAIIDGRNAYEQLVQDDAEAEL